MCGSVIQLLYRLLMTTQCGIRGQKEFFVAMNGSITSQYNH